MRKKVLILEDMETTRTALKRIVESCDDAITAYAFSEVGPALACMMENHIDLFFVDIILKPQVANDFSGIKFAEYVRKQEEYFGVDIIFVTSLIGLEAELLRKIHCYDYIEKPIDEQKVMQIVEEVLTRGEKSSKLPQRIYFRNDGIIYPVDVADIRYVVYQNRTLHVYDGDECIEVPNFPLKHFLEQVQDEVFLIPIKGTAVNIAYIEAVDYVNQFVKLKGITKQISMGSVLKRTFRKEYEEYVKRG